MRKRYVLCGASARGYLMYARAIVERYGKWAELAAIFDVNSLRASYVRDQVDKTKSIPVYTDFDQMLRDTKPNCVIVATMDSTHHTYCVRALDAGCDVICEKPMTIDAAKTIEMLEAEKRNNRRMTVTLNCRYVPFYKKIRQLVADGAIGKVLSVNFDWLLDRVHGADYFRRWHKWMEYGGGLLVTKATHHFDLVNWWIGQDPETVFANGSLDFYGPNGDIGAARCRDCAKYGQCDLAMEGFGDLSGTDMSFMEGMYFGPEKEDGYIRDQCVFASSDIYDNMSLAVRYKQGALLTYSLNAYMPYEGWHLSINGTKGRLRADSIHRGIGSEKPYDTVEVYTPDMQRAVYQVPRGEEMHGGSDEVLLRQLFVGDGANDSLHQAAGSREGAMSLLIGAAANESIRIGNVVRIPDLVDVDRYWPKVDT